MAETLQGTVVAEKAPPGTVPFTPTPGSQVLVLTPVEEEPVESDDYWATFWEGYETTTIKSEGEEQDAKISADYLGDAGELALKYKPVPGSGLTKPTDLVLERHVAFDLETTGTTPFDSKIIMATFWVLTDDKADMVTFADEDERILTIEIAEFLDQIQPYQMVAFNAAFDVVFLSSRMIKYMVGCKALYDAKFYDLQDWARRGISTYLSSTMKSGSLEDWMVFLFGEQKAYTIEQCFEAYEQGDITPFFIRNRQDVGATGDMYKLIRYVERESGFEVEPTELRGVEGTAGIIEGTAEVICEVCQQKNIYDYAKDVNRCFICNAILSPP